ncbi:MAG: HisA/HisF-related TIM barrel protein, partial [Ferruginibacter sp.]
CAKSHHIVNHKVLQQIASKTRLKIDFGGGLKSNEDVKIAFENGAAQITGGSIAAKNPVLFLEWLAEYGPDKIILGADCFNRKIATHGWQESSETDVIDFIAEYKTKGIEYVICTDISKDGMLQGASNELYTKIINKVNVKLIASGGVAGLDDLVQLEALGCEAAIVGKAIYENRITLNDLSKLC